MNQLPTTLNKLDGWLDCFDHRMLVEFVVHVASDPRRTVTARSLRDWLKANYPVIYRKVMDDDWRAYMKLIDHWNFNRCRPLDH